ncbi:hypothetical protein GCM10010275_19150 [Streptomyces litmocidini]|nr:hypothetical protein GCM10010275_19150 [Streptomyces litmocidini]
MGRGGQGAAVWTLGTGYRIQYSDAGDDPPRGDDPPQRRPQRIVPDVRGGPRRPVVDPYRQHGAAAVQGGLERGRAETPPGPPAPGRPLGEDDHPAPAGEHRGHGPDGAGQGPEPVAVDEEGAAERGERTEDGPAADLRLGHHPPGQHGRQEGDVQPGDVVGDDEERARHRAGRPLVPRTHPEGADHRSRPAPHEGEPGGGREQPRRRGEQDAEEDGAGPGGQPGHGEDRAGPLLRPAGSGDGVGRAVTRGAGRRGEPRREGRGPVHRAGTSDRKWSR